jgi:hypothetical protein
MIDSQLVVRAVRGKDHTYKGKTIETGFFDLPAADNISAIIFSNAGTLAKFDRMGIAAGFLPVDHNYVRIGYRLNPDPDAVHPLPFVEEIGREDYVEYWSDELQIFHNPRATAPLGEHVFSGVTQHFFKDGEQLTITPEGATLASFTWIIRLVDEKQDKAAVSS